MNTVPEVRTKYRTIPSASEISVKPQRLTSTPIPAVTPSTSVAKVLPYEMFMEPLGIVNVTLGALYGANIAKTGEMVVCVNNFQSLSVQSSAAFAYLMSNLTIYGGLITIDKYLGVAYIASGMTSDCFQGFFQAEKNLMKYTKFITKLSILYLNLIYNFGLIYESVKSVIYFFVYPARNTITSTYGLGEQVGYFFYDIFSA